MGRLSSHDSQCDSLLIQPEGKCERGRLRLQRNQSVFLGHKRISDRAQEAREGQAMPKAQERCSHHSKLHLLEE